MITKNVASALALASVLSFAAPAFAHGHMIDGPHPPTKSKPFTQNATGYGPLRPAMLPLAQRRLLSMLLHVRREPKSGIFRPRS
jgi:hypothetical protein